VKDKDNDRAVMVLGQMGITAQLAVPDLLKILKDSDPQLRQRAAQALGLMGPNALKAMPALQEAAKEDKNANVRRGAEEALKKIQPGGPTPIRP
jgi:HEAT repeat protein